jgi:hypothetical protein
VELLHMEDDVDRFDSSTRQDNFLFSPDRRIHPYLETKNWYLSGGPAEMLRINRFALDASADGGTVLTIASSSNDGSSWNAGYQLPTDSTIPPIYRFPVQKTRGTRLRMYNTYNGISNPIFQDEAPLRLNGITIYAAPLGRANSASPRYRG